MKTFSVHISIDDSVVVSLNDQGARLYAFLGSATTNRSAAPVVYASVAPAAEMTIAWDDRLSGYFSLTAYPAGDPKMRGKAVDVSGSRTVRPGDTVTIGDDNVETVTTGEGSGTVSFVGTTVPLVCGLQCGDPPTPFLAVDLADGIEVQLGQLARAFLMFSTDGFATSSWIGETQGCGLAIELADAASVRVTYAPDKAKPWTWPSDTDAYTVPHGKPIADVLVDRLDDPTTSARRETMRRMFTMFAATCTVVLAGCQQHVPGAAVESAPPARSTTRLSVDPVTRGLVVRGVNPAGTKDQGPPAKGCDFSAQEVDINGRLTGVSVQCGANKTVAQLIKKLPDTFKAYCAANVSTVGGRLIPAPQGGNPEHCDLSGITIKSANASFDKAAWR